MTRFGNNVSPLWQSFKILWQFPEGLFGFGHAYEPTLAKNVCYGPKFHCSKWPKLKRSTINLVTLQCSGECLLFLLKHWWAWEWSSFQSSYVRSFVGFSSKEFILNPKISDNSIIFEIIFRRKKIRKNKRRRQDGVKTIVANCVF